MFALSLVSFLGACFVSSGPRYRRGGGGRSCPPSYHWDGGGCVHNGKAKGHYKTRDHR